MQVLCFSWHEPSWKVSWLLAPEDVLHFLFHLPMSKSHLTQYLSTVPDCVSPMVYLLSYVTQRASFGKVTTSRENIPAHETAPLLVYKPIKLATYSLTLLGCCMLQ